MQKLSQWNCFFLLQGWSWFYSLHLELIYFGLGKEQRSRRALQICSAFPWINVSWLPNVSCCSSLFSSYTGAIFRLQSKSKNKPSRQQVYVSDQLRNCVSPLQKVFHIFTAALPKRVSADLLHKAHSQNQTTKTLLHTALPPKRVSQEPPQLVKHTFSVACPTHKLSLLALK